MDSQVQANARHLELDALKGFAILLVIMGHAMYFSLGHYSSSFYEILVSVHMPLFVAVSGYLSARPLAQPLGGGVRYWKTKIYRLILPLLLLPTLYQYILFGQLNLPLACILNEYWFTYTLFLLYIIFYLSRSLIQHLTGKVSKRWRPWIEGCLAILAIFAVEYLFSHPLGAWKTRLNAGATIWLYKYLVIGYLLGRSSLLSQYLRNELVGAIAGLTFIGSIVAYFYFDFDFTYGNTPLISIYTLIGLSAFSFAYHVAYRLTNPTSRLSQVMVYLGKQSLAIYLVHYFFLFDMSGLRYHLESITRPHLQLGAEILSTLTISLCTLAPTLITIKWIQSNKYLAFIILGDPIRKHN